jgi:hypothetical protein
MTRLGLLTIRWPDLIERLFATVVAVEDHELERLRRSIVVRPVIVAGGVWISRRISARRETREVRQYRNWHGYVDLAGISSWYARVIE